MAHYAKYKLGASTVAILYDIDDTYSKELPTLSRRRPRASA